VILEGLALLEYRGYDSAGVAVIGEEGMRTAKKAGRLDNLRSALEAAPLPTGPYSPVDLRTPPAVGDADDLLRRLEIELCRPGQTLEHAFLIAQAMRRGRVP